MESTVTIPSGAPRATQRERARVEQAKAAAAAQETGRGGLQEGSQVEGGSQGFGKGTSADRLCTHIWAAPVRITTSANRILRIMAADREPRRVCV